MPPCVQAFARDDSGQGLVEYSLVLGLIAAAAIAGLTTFGQATNSSLSNSAVKLH